MKKKISMFFLLFNVVFSKNIYVVYDDSLSMKKENRDIYANYALQTLASLLSEDDNLTITRMSDIKDDFRNKTVVNLKDINNELKYFEKNLNAKSKVTPYRSIETIVDYIDRTSSKDDQNWLMIITDGEFEDGKPIPNIERIKESISESVQQSNLKPVFLLIGSNQKELEAYEKQKGIEIWKDIFGEGEFPKIFKAANQKDIIVKMREIAQLLTSKSAKNSEKIYTIDNNKLEFNSLFPLSKIIFLDQTENGNELNSLQKVYIDGKEVDLSKQYKPFKNERKITLAANVIHIEGNNNNIVLEFKDKVAKEIKVLPEVSAKFKVSLLSEDGKELKNGLLQVPSEDEFKIIGKLLKGDSNEMLQYVEGTDVSVNYGSDRIVLKYNDEKNIYEGSLKVEKGRKSIDGTAEFPGYFYYQSDIYIIEGVEPKPKVILPPPVVVEPPKPPEPPKEYKMSADIFPGVQNFVTQKDLGEKKFYIVPKVNGKVLSEEEIKGITIKLDSDLDGELSKKKYIDSSDSFGWEYKPSVYSKSYNFKNPEGEKKIEVILENKDENKKITDKRVLKFEEIGFWDSYGELIKKILLMITGAILIIGYCKKKRFKKGEKIVIEEVENDFKKPNRRVILKSSFMNTITPYKDDECNIEGLIFVANGGGKISITADSFNKVFNKSSINKVYMNGDILDKDDLKLGKKDVYTLYKEDSIELVYDGRKRKYIYTLEK
ncbi:MAG: hypothetical protein ACRC5G_00505 [Cetobacterium sp.]